MVDKKKILIQLVDQKKSIQELPIDDKYGLNRKTIQGIDRDIKYMRQAGKRA